MAVLGGTGGLSNKILIDFAITLPALAAGTALGIFMFGKVDDLMFRRIVLAVLFASGLSFIF